MKRQEILRYMESLAPVRTAESWDNVGLMCGDDQADVKGVLVALDVTMDVIEEAREKGCDLILSHHPLIFRGMKSVTPATVEGRKLMALLAAGMGVISMHTNLDVAQGGVNDILAAALGLTEVELLEPTYTHQWKKLEVYVPEDHKEAVLEAMAQSGAGRLEAYDSCAFSAQGEGRFRPLEGANPYLGERNRLERACEVKLEVTAPAEKMPGVIKAMLAVHPYEVPAYYVLDTDAPRQQLGLGRVGRLPEPMAMEDFLAMVKEKLGAEGLRFTGWRDRVQKVAVGGGACVEFADRAFAMGADAYVTADCKYHDMLTAWEKGQCIVDADHFETENGICRAMAGLLRQRFQGLKIEVSQRHKSVVRYWR